MREQQDAIETDHGAAFSECRKYRYALWRIWDRTKPLAMFIGLNPSTANETDNDPTIKSVGRISNNNGFGGFYMMNCFPLVSTDPSVLKSFYLSASSFEQYQYTLNRQRLMEISVMCRAVVFAWGSFSVVQECRVDKELMQMFPDAMALHINKNGSPKHPLYCKSDTQFINYQTNPNQSKNE